MDINIGDKVRFLNDIGGGIVSGFQKGGIVLVQDEDGKLQFTRLDEGIYYLKETQSPAGYTLLANPVKIEITASEMNQVATGTFTLKVNDKEITATDGSFVTKLNTDSGISTVAVENQKGFSLPETGGIGIMIFLGIGIVGILILSGIMVKKMKL